MPCHRAAHPRHSAHIPPSHGAPFSLAASFQSLWGKGGDPKRQSVTPHSTAEPQWSLKAIFSKALPDGPTRPIGGWGLATRPWTRISHGPLRGLVSNASEIQSPVSFGGSHHGPFSNLCTLYSTEKQNTLPDVSHMPEPTNDGTWDFAYHFIIN